MNRIEDRLLEVREWMDANFFKLNDEKTEVALFGSRQQQGKVTLNGLNMCDVIVRLQDVAIKGPFGSLGFPDGNDQSN